MNPLKPVGFSLAELLVTVLILGIIAIFTIPKLLVVQQNQKNIAVAKEAAHILSGALQTAFANGTLTSSTKIIDLAPYINYVSLDTSGTTLDGIPSIASITCDSSHPCFRLHNGAAIGEYEPNESFGGTSTTNCLEVYIDPNGIQDTSATADGPNKSVAFLVYYDGFLTTRDTPRIGSRSSVAVKSAQTYFTPSWFSWR